MLVPCSQTEDGFEHHLQVNFLSPILLITLLTGKLLMSSSPSKAGRIVNVSSVVHHVASLDSRALMKKYGAAVYLSLHYVLVFSFDSSFTCQTCETLM